VLPVCLGPVERTLTSANDSSEAHALVRSLTVDRWRAGRRSRAPGKIATRRGPAGEMRPAPAYAHMRASRLCSVLFFIRSI